MLQPRVVLFKTAAEWNSPFSVVAKSRFQLDQLPIPWPVTEARQQCVVPECSVTRSAVALRHPRALP